MKKTAVAASLLAGLLSVGLGHVYFQRLEAEVSGGPKVRVLVAVKDVPVGGILAEKLIGVREIPRAYVEQRNVRAQDLKKVIDARIGAGLKANDTILWSDMEKFSDKSRVLSGLVQQGMRAVPLDGADVDFGGLLRPGDRVDVLLTVGDRGNDTGSTRTLLQNLLVLSVGRNIARANETVGRLRSGGIVTLGASVENAQVLAQARRRGELSLTLRNSEDITMVEGLPETTNAGLTARVDVPEEKKSRRITPRGRIERVR